MTIRFKHLAFLCTTILAMPLLSGCGGNDDDEPTSGNNHEQSSTNTPNLNKKYKLLSTINKTGSQTDTYEYDNEGRLVKVSRLKSYEIDYYTYSSDKISYISDSGRESRYMYYLKNGLITKYQNSRHTERWTEFIYDKDNRLRLINNYDGKSYNVIWENGDIVQIGEVKFKYSSQTCLTPLMYYKGGNGFNFEMGLDWRDFFPLDPALVAQGYFGKRCFTHLIKSTYSPTYNTHVYFEYTLSEFGLPTKITTSTKQENPIAFQFEDSYTLEWE